jgi:prepilin-type N-terminal cleavage/methylation domain-containing protein
MKKGFTLIELMMVMVVMAIIATLATGAAMKSIQQGKIQRINATSTVLQMALMNYRTVEGHWPLVSGDTVSTNSVSFSGTKNALVFAPLLESNKREYVDTSALLTQVPGLGVLTVREALSRKVAPESCPIGYPDPEKSGTFNYFKVTIDFDYDIVKVTR